MSSYDIARKLLQLGPMEPLPERLVQMLSSVAARTTVGGGELRSRQVIALLILVWECTKDE